VKASCHCGAVTLRVDSPPAEVAECNCSICRRIAARWAYYHPAEVAVRDDGKALVRYVQGDRTLALCHCSVCGCTTHWEPLPGTEVAADGPKPRMGVNARLIENFDLTTVPVRQVDGASF